MRKISIIAAALLAGVLALAQDRIVERTFVSTDRSVYVAGDDVWCSAFCIDVTDGGHLSDFSSICYVEIVSADGVVANCKVALENGRGAGHLRIPVNTPTGNYRILAYTATNRNEKDFDYLAGSGVISIFNTLSNARAEKVTFEKPAQPSAAGSSVPSDLNVYCKDGRVVVENKGPESVSAALSVALRDDIPEPVSTDIHDFTDMFAKGVKVSAFTNGRLPEYDGEILYIKVPESFSGATGYISSPGNKTNIYTSDVDENGLLTFFTGNIYGEMNMVFQLDDKAAGAEYPFEVESPFVTPEVKDLDIPYLYMGEEYSEDLLRRSLSMQIADKFGVTILSDKLPQRPNLLFSDEYMVSYNLDDYTRFQTLTEVFIEYVKQASVRKDRIQVIVNDNVYETSQQATLSNHVLVMVDGVAVLDHKAALDMDPNLVKKIEIYQRSVAVGNRVFGGVVNFVTVREDMAGLKLPDSSRMLDFHGTCYPVALTGERIDKNYPDYRQTLVWQPLLTLAPGEKLEFDCLLPAYEGTFIIKAVGLSESGKAQSCSALLN